MRAKRILLAHFGLLDLWEGYFMEEELELRRFGGHIGRKEMRGRP